MKIAVIGTGYVGLVTGTCLAETGNDVICVDINKKKVEMMQNGQVPIYEPLLEQLFERNIKAGRLSFTTSLAEAVEPAQVVFLALPTPPGEDGSADLSYILTVAEELGGLIKDYKVIVDKSTVPVGTSELVWKKIAEHCSVEFDVASNPEFLREGFAVTDFMKPDRVVIGSSSDHAKKVLGELYRPYVRQGNPILFMDERSAELTKYAANAFLATKITFMNEVANLCEKVGADVDMVRIGIGADARIGKRFLFPGIGYGGSCFPKDVLALNKTSKDYGYHFRILESVMAVNEMQKKVLIKRVRDYFGGSVQGKKITFWGLAFKPDTDDIREAPALTMISEFLADNANISVFDPEAMKNTRNVFGDRLTYCNDQYECLKDSDALVIATEWGLFRTPDFHKMGNIMKSKVIFDGRNLYGLPQMRDLGFYYSSIGRETVQPKVAVV